MDENAQAQQLLESQKQTLLLSRIDKTTDSTRYVVSWILGIIIALQVLQVGGCVIGKMSESIERVRAIDKATR